MCGSPLSRSTNGLSDARFADAGLARDQHDAAVAALRLLPAAQEQVDLLVAADERRGGRAQRLEPALGGARAQHLPRRHILGEALERDGAEIAILEQAADQPPCARCNHHGARLGQRLEASGKVGRLADDRLLLGRARADEVADHDEPGRDPDAHLQGDAGGGVELRHRLDQGKPGADRALGIMLVGLRIAEIGEHAVAHVLGDEAAVALDQLRAAAVIGADDRPAGPRDRAWPTAPSSPRGRRTSP